MHGLLRHRPRDEQGAVAILVGTMLVALLVGVGLVLDFGLARVDRQIDKSAADSAAVAGAYGLNLGDGTPHSYAGVCSAIRFLKQNQARFSSLTTTTGWTNGNGVATASGCTDTSLRNKQCKGTDKTTWAAWKGSATYQGVTIDVTIQGGYVLPSSSATTNWPEDNLSASLGDTGDPSYAGCDQLAVTIVQRRKPGFGSLATSSDLATAVRSVARVEAKPGGNAPAMLLLKRTGCPVLVTGSSGGSSYIHVAGFASTTQSQPGTIHSDSDGVGCNGGNNSWIFGGLAPNGIIAYAAPLVGSPTQPDPAYPGQITSVASSTGITGTPVRDSNSNVYGSSVLSGTGGTHSDVGSRGLVTRGLVDKRYFGCATVSATCTTPNGVKGIISAASTLFATGATSAPSGWTSLSASNVCKPTPAEVTASVNTAINNTGGKLYIGCTGPNGFEGSGTSMSIGATQIYFKGMVGPASGLALSMPNATKVYIGNHADKPNAVSISNGTSFSINDAPANLSGGNCSTGQSTSKSVLVIRAGQFKETGGLLRMCRTTTIMMGGDSQGCVPATAGTAPNTSTPCGGTAMGTGQFTQGSSGIDWTAPDTIDLTKDPVTGKSTAAAVAAWLDVNGPEDLALWTESGSNTSSNYSMAGGGLFQVRGVFMAPNADPFTLSGGAHMDLTNAQFVTSSIALNGSNTSVDMKVDPNAAVTLPEQAVVGLVR